MNAGAPAIIGRAYTNHNQGIFHNDYFTGVFYGDTFGGTFSAGVAASNFAKGVNFSAQRSNTIYGSSNTITPLSVKVKWFVKY